MLYTEIIPALRTRDDSMDHMMDEGIPEVKIYDSGKEPIDEQEFDDMLYLSVGSKAKLTRNLGEVGKAVGLVNGQPVTIVGFWYDEDTNGVLNYDKIK